MTLRDLLVGQNEATAWLDIPLVTVTLTLNELAGTSLALDRLHGTNEPIPVLGESLRVFWDTAYRDAHKLLDQKIDVAWGRNNVQIERLR